ncbi:hypothetical protein MP228_005096 [Amoeboaphelidium protococcarum]|nr:hypothetical protein MP228_005096 [Amoeboaphelidium protococcarum]
MDLIIIDPPVFSDGRVCYHPQELYTAEFVRRNFMTAQFIERLWKLEYSPWIQSVQNGTINARGYVPIKIKFDILLDRDEKSYVEYLIKLSRLAQELQSGPWQDSDTQNQQSSSECKDAHNVQRILRDLPSGYLLVEEWVVEYPLPCPYYFALDRRKYICKTGIDKPLDSSDPFALNIELSKSLKAYGHPSGQAFELINDFATHIFNLFSINRCDELCSPLCCDCLQCDFDIASSCLEYRCGEVYMIDIQYCGFSNTLLTLLLDMSIELWPCQIVEINNGQLLRVELLHLPLILGITSRIVDANILKGDKSLSRESPDYQQVLELNNLQSKSLLKCIILEHYRSALIQYHSLISAWTADGGISTTPHLGSQSVDMVFMHGYCICINDIIVVTLNSAPHFMLVQSIEVYSELGQWRSGLFRGSLLQHQLNADGKMMEDLNDVSCGFEHFISRSHGPLYNSSVYDQPPLDTYNGNDAVAAIQFNKFFPKLNMTTDYQNCSYQRHTNDRMLEQYMEETILRVPQLLLYAPPQ